MILLLILWGLYAVSDAYEDSRHPPFRDHRPTFYSRVVVGAISLICLVREPVLMPSDLLAYLLPTACLVFTFWFVFELACNHFQGKYIGYIGTTSWLDKKLKPHELPMLFLRFFLAVSSIALYFTW